MTRILLRFVALCSLCGLMSANMCTKVIAYGTDTYTPPVTKSYYSNVPTVMQESKEVLENLGYQVVSTDESRNRITTGWLPVKSDSHYFNLFNRKDFSGASGAYYQVVMDITDATPSTRVSVSTTVKSVAGTLSTNHVVENKILENLDNQLRSPQIEMTNVGVKNR